MARLFRDRGDSLSRRESLNSPVSESNGGSSSSSSLPSPFGPLSIPLSDPDLQYTAYEIFVSACRTSAGSRPLTYTPQSERSTSSASPSSATSASPSSGSSLQRSLTSAAASKMKKALGLKSKSGKHGENGNKTPTKKAGTIGELMRIQMRVSEQTDARIRKGLLRIAASQLGRRVESMVIPLELLQQFKSSDFPDQQEYDTWRSRNLKILEAGLLLHPLVPLQRSDPSAQRLKQILRGNPIETGKNSESMQTLRTAVSSLANRSFDGSGPDTCHWADGPPLNLYLYQKLLEACFEINDEGSLIDEVDEVLELIKKTWSILGINQIYHNLCFLWILFNKYVSSAQNDIELLSAADNLLAEVAKDAKICKDPVYCKILNTTLSAIMGWSERRLLAYHEAFNAGNIEAMQCIVDLGVCSAQVLVEDIAHEYRRRKKGGKDDVARSTVDTYIRSSLRTAFAQKMEEVDSNRRHQTTPAPILSVLAKDIGALAKKEKDLFTPVLSKYHPLAAGVAVATLHSCYGNELKQFVAGLTELTSDSVQVLKSASELETDLVSIAVEESVESEDGGKGIIREMPPFEAEVAIANLVRDWISVRVDRLKAWVDRNLQQETWKAGANRDSCAPSAVEVLRIIDETLDAYFDLPIPMHRALLPDLTIGLDRSLQHYASKAKSGCGTRSSYMPALPALTRCEVGSKLFRKKEKTNPQSFPKRKPQTNGSDSLSLPQLCVRLNTIYHIKTELENLEKKIKTCLRNVENAHADITDGLDIKFELTSSACLEAIQALSESTAYKVVFHDMSHVLYESLYIPDPSNNRIDLFIKELDPTLELISSTLHDRLRNRVITALMKASFDGFLLVILCGGPLRNFAKQDFQILDEDFKNLKSLFFADGDGLPEEILKKGSLQAINVLSLFRLESESLIERYKKIIIESFGNNVRNNKFPLPPTNGNWSPNDANTILRVLCNRHDEVATKFLKKTYNLPKKLSDGIWKV